MDKAIKNICEALKEEADAVISYTDKIADTNATEGMGETANTLEIIRLDEVEHIQNLCLELTKLITSGEAPAEPASGEGNE